MVLASGLLLRFIRSLGIVRFPLSKKVLLAVGVFPIIDHYYEPRFDFRRMRRRLDEERPCREFTGTWMANFVSWSGSPSRTN
jgi:hypothetical protein